MLASGCKFCHPILFRALREHIRPKTIVAANSSNIVHLYKNQGVALIYVHCGNIPTNFPGLAPVRQKSLPGELGCGRIIDPEWVDSAMLRRWKTRCEKDHGEACEVSLAATNFPLACPTWLIDTWRMCLSPGHHGDRYIALSYVWGSSKFIQTTKETLEKFQKDQAFSSTEDSLEIPRTIRDAMTLVGILRERYLWVDSLCIVQDDDDSKQDQLNSMCATYANACITIVAAEGEDADYGLCGIRGMSNSRLGNQEVFKLPNRSKVIERRRSQLEKTIWDGRAWTFQEYLFSKRRIIFEGGRVQWECMSHTWYEDFELMDSSNRHTVETSRHDYYNTALSLRWPDLESYAIIISRFNRRNLTYPEDALDCFSGIMSHLSHAFPFGFLSGLPELFLDIALLWTPKGTVERRKPSAKSSAGACLPSWSWIGWQGDINPHDWAVACEFIKFHPTRHSYNLHEWYRRTVSILQWYCIEKVGMRKRPALSRWDLYKSGYLPENRQLPPGWTRHRYYRPSWDRRDYDVLEENHVYFFTHETAPGVDFWYPIPISNDADVSSIQPPINLLFCRTQRTWLYTDGKTTRGDERPQQYLEDNEGLRVGVLRLHNHDLIPGSTDARFQRPKCELIAISRGYSGLNQRVNDLSESYSSLDKNARYEFYNVLWINWKDGVAYRQGFGYVLKDVWESQPLGWVDVTLG